MKNQNVFLTFLEVGDKDASMARRGPASRSQTSPCALTLEGVKAHSSLFRKGARPS